MNAQSRHFIKRRPLFGRDFRRRAVFGSRSKRARRRKMRRKNGGAQKGENGEKSKHARQFSETEISPKFALK
jgi:hypothetical protein